MTSVLQRLGLPMSANCYFSFDGSRYYFSERNLNALRIISKVASVYSSKAPLGLRQCRAHIDWIKRERPRALLAYVIATSCNRDVRLIATWLRGMCGGYIGANAIRDIGIATADPLLEVTCAKTLRRMRAAVQLHELGEQTRLGQERPELFEVATSKVFANRIQQFLKNVEQGPQPTLTKRSAELQDNTAANETGRPAKPLWLIRLVLDRISHRVSSTQAGDRIPPQL